MSSENDVGLWTRIAAAALSGLGLLFGYQKWINARLDKKADKHYVNNELQRMNNEIGVQRGHIGKIFDQMRENEQRAEDRHRELMMQLLKGSK
jgi:hypothetical protein